MANIVLKDLVKRFGNLEVLHQVSLNIEHGEFIVFVGPSGCGKSTTLRMLAGLETVDGGEILIGGKEVSSLAPRERNISMVFQDYALYPHMTVRKNLGFGLKVSKIPAPVIASKVAEVSKMLGLEEYMDRKPKQLSGGQRQRVAMGRAIVRSPEVYLFDEPLSNLDAKLRTQMRTEIKMLHQKVANTIVYVTHDQIEAMTMADRIVVMRDGIIEQVGTPEAVYKSPRNVFVATFIGSPPMSLVPGGITKGETQPEFQGDCGTVLPIPNRLKSKVSIGQKVLLGIRSDAFSPENHGLPNDGTQHMLVRDITRVETMGSETLITAMFGESQVLSKMFNPVPVDGSKQLEFTLQLDACYLFDAHTELSLDTI